jgi:hypothetical protein
VFVVSSVAGRGAAAGPGPSERRRCRRTAAVAIASGEAPSGRPGHPPGLVAQAGQRGAYALEEALVRSVGVLPLLLQR